MNLGVTIENYNMVEVGLANMSAELSGMGVEMTGVRCN